jgi:hypothetical protein
MRPEEAKVGRKHAQTVRWSEASLKYTPVRTNKEMHAAAADGVCRWKIASRDYRNARTKQERDAAAAAIRQIIIDEDSGKIPFVDITDSLPAYVPLPSAPGDVVATVIPKASSMPEKIEDPAAFGRLRKAVKTKSAVRKRHLPPRRHRTKTKAARDDE